MNRLIPVSLLALLAAVPAVAALSQARNDQNRDELKSLQAEYRDETIRARRLRADAADATAEIANLNRQLADLRRAQGADDSRMASQRARLNQLSRREAVLVAALSKERARQGRLLSALQMMSRSPPPPLLIPAGKAVDTVRAAILMRAMAPELERRARLLVADQGEVARIRRLAVLSSEQLLTTESAQDERRNEMETLSTRKIALNAVLRADAQRSEQAARVLEARIRSLGGEVTAPGDDRIGGDDKAGSASRLPGGRQHLSSPVPGPPDVDYSGSGGLRWKASGGAVVAPAGATVDYAGPLSGWGEVVILNLGPGWRAVIAGLDSVSVEAGGRVDEGEALGRSGAEGEVYFELRRDERAVDPTPWLE